MRAAIHAVRAEGAARVIVAVPVGAPEAVASRFGRDDLEGVFLHLADGGGAA